MSIHKAGWPSWRVGACAVAVSCWAAACTSTAAGTPVAVNARTPTAASPSWPAGVPTPPPPRPAPSIGASEAGAGTLLISYEPPHLRLSSQGSPDGLLSVTYVVQSVRDKRDMLQIDSTDARTGYAGMLEYARLGPGEYLVTQFYKGATTPIDQRRVRVP